jgi:predicted ATPase with chaperone activity
MTVTYPAKFIFIAAMNPCPCDYYGFKDQHCTCSDKRIKAYNGRVSGPILDRMDLLLSLKAVNLKDHDFAGIESSEDIMKRVCLGRLEILQLKSLPKVERDRVLRRVKEIEGVVQLQAARFLGVAVHFCIRLEVEGTVPVLPHSIGLLVLLQSPCLLLN